MRVLHLHSGNLYGGVETFLLTLARCRTWSPSVEMEVGLCFDQRIARELRDEQVPITMLGEVRLRRPDSVWRARRALEALLKERTYDVVVCHQAWPLVVFGTVVKAAGLPLVSWSHMAQTGHHWLDRLAGRVQPDCYICNSRFSASVLPPTDARVEVIYYPVMADETHAKVEGEPGIVIVQVSRMEAMKGQTVLIEALGRLRDEPGWVCWQVGGAQRAPEARYLASLRADAERLGVADRIRFLGQRTDVPALLAAADIFCQPNVQPEPFGISFVEALLAGRPVVASATGGVLEIVDDTCGVLIEPGDVTALAAALSRLIRDSAERERLGRNGPKRA
ncbi:MAG TPA: glycosyltransferase family 4 protein, partial [Vicinamibacterales bacterium]